MTAQAGGGSQRLQIEDFRITEEPYYLPTADQVALFETYDGSWR